MLPITTTSHKFFNLALLQIVLSTTASRQGHSHVNLASIIYTLPFHVSLHHINVYTCILNLGHSTARDGRVPEESDTILLRWKVKTNSKLLPSNLQLFRHPPCLSTLARKHGFYLDSAFLSKFLKIFSPFRLCMQATLPEVMQDKFN